ncbi:MAG: hypothetical protein QY326_05525 [Bdellovibrionota bacterium]|nr:MAG: hypothetical protein QY326_05525 [Bdellovibrionota bacterium]
MSFTGNEGAACGVDEFEVIDGSESAAGELFYRDEINESGGSESCGGANPVLNCGEVTILWSGSDTCPYRI